MIQAFREQPLRMFAGGATVAVGLSLMFGAGAFIAYSSFRMEKANAFVFPSAALLWLGLACYLLMLGLIAEVALREHQREYPPELPLVSEETA